MNYFLHSYRTDSSLKNGHFKNPNALITNIWLYALSVAYVNRAGYKIVLHTDDLGKDLLDFVPYERVFTTLNKCQCINSRFFAAGKIEALKCADLGAVHIDHDVFLKNKKLCKSILDFRYKYDVISQNRERIFFDEEKNMYDTYEILYDLMSQHLFWKFPTFELGIFACNTGVLGFANKKLREIYVKQYDEMTRQWTKNRAFWKVLDDNREAAFDLIPEQLNLWNVIHHGNFKAKFVFNELNTWSIVLRKKAKKIGYCHLLAETKYQRIEDVKMRLKKINPELYSTAEARINELSKEYKNQFSNFQIL
jgi:hypothetical protein